MHWVISNGKAKLHAVLVECIKYIVRVMEQWDMAVVVEEGAEQCQAEQSRAKRCRAGQSARLSQAEKGRAEQGRA